MKLKGIRFSYNAAAYFASLDKYHEGLIDELRKPGQAGFEALCWTLAEMAKQAELMRRHMGETPEEPPTEEDFRIGLRPGQIGAASKIALEAIVKGMRGGEDDEDAEIDEVLVELQKQKKTDEA